MSNTYLLAFLWISLLFLPMCVPFEAEASETDSRMRRVYAVLAGPQADYRTQGKARLGASSWIVSMMQKRGFLWFDLDSMTLRLDNRGFDGISNLDYAECAYVGTAVRLCARQFAMQQFLIQDRFTVTRHFLDEATQLAGFNNAPYGPTRSGYVYTADLTDSASLPEIWIGAAQRPGVDSVLFLQDKSGKKYYTAAWDFPTVHRTPLRDGSKDNHLSNHPPVWNGRRWYTMLNRSPQPSALFSFLPGDTSFVRIDSMAINGVKRKLSPERMTRMWSDSVFYQDSTGFFAMMVGDSMTTPSLPFQPHSFRIQNEWFYVFRFDSDSVRVAFTDRNRWPQWIRWSIHPDFQTIHLQSWRDNFPAQYVYGDLGVSLGHSFYLSDLITSPSHPYPFALTSLVGQDSMFPAYQGMLATWRDGEGRPMVVSDQGCVTRVVRPGFGYITHPSLFHDELKDRVKNIYQSTFLYGALPWYGIRRPQAWRADDGDTLVHAGAVVRRLRRGGDMLDTLAPVSAQAWCRLDANRWAFADHRSVTIVGPKGASTTAVPYDSVRFRPGYASSLVPLQDGSLLVSYYGAVRADTDLVGQPYRRGGMVRLRSDGTTAPVPIPSEAGSYVYPVHRLDGGVLVALSATFSDDTIIGENINRQGLNNVRVLTSTDDGTTWSASESLFFNGPWVPTTGRFVRTGPQTILGVMPGSMIVSSDNGTTWNFDERFTVNQSVCDFDITGDTMLLATRDGLYQYVQQITSVADTATPPASESRTMSREAFIAMVEQLGENCIIVDIRGRRIYNVQSVHSGMMVIVKTVTGVTKIIVE